MQQFKFLPLLGALAVAAIVAGSGSARADEILFGNITPSSGVTGGAPACTHVAGDEGFVCGNPQTFSAEGSTFTATGYSNGDAFSTQSALTWKPVDSNGLDNGVDESGLGENASAPTSPTASACTDSPGGTGATSTPCEIGVGASVTVSSTIPIVDLQVGSVQSPEQFEVWTATTVGGPFTELGTFTSASAACNYDGVGLCTFNNLPTGTVEVGVVDLAANSTDPTGQSDVLLTAVSIVPAPPIGQGLPAVIAIGGLLFGVWAWDRSKKRRLLGAAAITHAAA